MGQEEILRGINEWESGGVSEKAPGKARRTMECKFYFHAQNCRFTFLHIQYLYGNLL